MSHEGFLRDIIAHPDDDAVRLIYADWLDDRGDPRGEFIRLQVAAAIMDRPRCIHDGRFVGGDLFVIDSLADYDHGDGSFPVVGNRIDVRLYLKPRDRSDGNFRQKTARYLKIVKVEPDPDGDGLCVRVLCERDDLSRKFDPKANQASRMRQRKLIKENWREWIDPLWKICDLDVDELVVPVDLMADSYFRRGLLEMTHIDVAPWLDNHKAILASYPIREVRFMDWPTITNAREEHLVRVDRDVRRLTIMLPQLARFGPAGLQGTTRCVAVSERPFAERPDTDGMVREAAAAAFGRTFPGITFVMPRYDPSYNLTH